MLLTNEAGHHQGRKKKPCRLICMMNKNIRLIPLTELWKCKEIEVEEMIKQGSIYAKYSSQNKSIKD